MPSHSAAQIHIRVSREFKRAMKIFCAREGVTEQSWGLQVLEKALVEYAPDLATSRAGKPHKAPERRHKP